MSVHKQDIVVRTRSDSEIEVRFTDHAKEPSFQSCYSTLTIDAVKSLIEKLNAALVLVDKS